MTTRRLTTLIASAAFLVASAPAEAAPTWTPPTDLSTVTDPFALPQIDVSPEGESLIAIHDSLGSGKYGFRVNLRSPGQAFSEQILPAGGSVQVPQDAVAAVDLVSGGQGIVAWQQSNGLFYALRSPGGAFGAPQPVTGQSTIGISSLKVAVDGAGNATFLWSTQTGAFPDFISHVYAVVRRPDGQFVNAQTLSTITNSEFTSEMQSLDVNTAGDAVATWRETGPGLGDAHYIFRAGALSQLSAVQNVPAAIGIDGAIDTAGDAAVAVAATNGVEVRHKKAGGALGPAAVVGSSTSSPDVGISGAGTAVVVWPTLAGGGEALMSCSFTTAGCISPPETVATDPTSLGGARVAVAGSGAAVVLWDTDPFGAATVRARTRAPGGAWGAEQTVARVNSTDGTVGIDDAADAIGAWTSKSAGTIRLRSATLDVVAPKLGTVDIPATAVSGTAVGMSASASDNFGPVALTWSFGDGAGASGSVASHTFGSAATRTVTVTATDASGNTISQARVITVAAKPTGGGTSADTAPRFTTAPRTLNRRFRIRTRHASRTGERVVGRKHAKVGTVFIYGLDKQGTVTIALRSASGSSNAMKLTHKSVAGANRVAFNGRVGKRSLRPGRYLARFTARTATGITGKSVTIAFTVVRR